MVELVKARVLRKCFVSNRLYDIGDIAYVHPRKLRSGIIVDFDEYEKAREKHDKEAAKKRKGVVSARTGPMSEEEQAALYEERLEAMRQERAPVTEAPLPDLIEVPLPRMDEQTGD